MFLRPLFLICTLSLKVEGTKETERRGLQAKVPWRSAAFLLLRGAREPPEGPRRSDAVFQRAESQPV